MSGMKICTFNLRNPWAGDGINAFMHRMGLVYDKINEEKPDAVAFQEVMPKQKILLARLLPEYEFIGQGRNADHTGEGLYIAVRKDVWSVVAYETFWISPAPHSPGSRFPSQSEYPRICNVFQIRRKESGKMLRIFNIHLDHACAEARTEGIKCVLKKVAEWNARLSLPTVILGDFNSEPYSEAIRYCNSNPNVSVFDVTGSIARTNHDFGRNLPTSPTKIDYIYVTAELANKHVKTEAWEDCHEGIYLSDHFPICAKFEY